MGGYIRYWGRGGGATAKGKGKGKGKTTKACSKEGCVKSAAGAALAAIFAIPDGQEPLQEPRQELPQELPKQPRRVLCYCLLNEVLNESFIGLEEPL